MFDWEERKKKDFNREERLFIFHILLNFYIKLYIRLFMQMYLKYLNSFFLPSKSFQAPIHEKSQNEMRRDFSPFPHLILFLFNQKLCKGWKNVRKLWIYGIFWGGGSRDGSWNLSYRGGQIFLKSNLCET